MLHEECLQVISLKPLAEQRLVLADNVEVHQRQDNLRQPELLAHQPAVDLDLGPVQLPVVGRLFVQVAAIGFHLFQLVAVRVVAIRPAPDFQLLVFALQRDFILVMGAAPRGHGAVADNPFLGTGRRGKTQVEVADLGGEFT